MLLDGWERKRKDMKDTVVRISLKCENNQHSIVMELN